MSRIYATKQFTKLQKEWYEKLKESGFSDIEDKWGFFKVKQNKNTTSWRYKESIFEFYYALGHYITNTKRFPKNHRQVLTLWAAGVHLVDIAKQLNMTIFPVKQIVAKYKKIILNLPIETDSDSE